MFSASPTFFCPMRKIGPTRPINLPLDEFMCLYFFFSPTRPIKFPLDEFARLKFSSPDQAY